MTSAAPQHPRRRVIDATAALVFAGAMSAPARASSDSLLRSSLEETAADRLDRALEQFASLATWVELGIGVFLAVALASLLAFHPRGRIRRNAADAAEERKTLIGLGMIGAVVASLVLVDQAMAFVVFGIGALFRFRSGIGGPPLTSRAILVVMVGLACGLSQYVAALVIATASWILIWWLQARRGGEIKVRIPIGADRRKAEVVASLELANIGCRVRSLRAGASGRSFTMVLSIPAAIEELDIARRLEERLAIEIGHSEVEVKSAG